MKKFFKTPFFIAVFLLTLLLVSFGAKSLIAATANENPAINDYTVVFPKNLEGTTENGLQYAVAKKSTNFIGTYEEYGNWQPTAGINSANIKNNDKIKFLIKFSEGYSHLKVSDIKLINNESQENLFSLKVYDINTNGMLTERDPQKDEFIIPGKNYPTSELKINKNLNLSFSGIKADNYSIKISMKEDPQNTKDSLDVYYYFLNESNKKKMDFSADSNSYELNNLAYGSGINLIIERSDIYNQTELNLNNLEGANEFTNKSQNDSIIKLNTSVNKNYDIKINKAAEKNTYKVKNGTTATIEYKLLKENEYKPLENGDSFTATHGENYNFKYENLEKTLTANNNLLYKNNYIYSLYNISNNIDLTATEELSGTNVPIYLPTQEDGVFIVDESGKNQLINPSTKYGESFSFRLKQTEGYTQNFDNIEVYKNSILENDRILLLPNGQNTKNECSGLYTIENIRQPIKIETSKPVKNVYEVSVAQNLKNAKIEVSGKNVTLDKNTKDLGTKVYDVEDNGEIEITVTPNEGYTTKNMTLDVNSDISPNVSLANNKFTVSSIKSPTTLNVQNVRGTNNITLTVEGDDLNAECINVDSGIYGEPTSTSEKSKTYTITNNQLFMFTLKDDDITNYIVTDSYADDSGNHTVTLIKGDKTYKTSVITSDHTITVKKDTENTFYAVEVCKLPKNENGKCPTINYSVNNTNSPDPLNENGRSITDIPANSNITFTLTEENGFNKNNLAIMDGTEFKNFGNDNKYTINNIKASTKILFLNNFTNPDNDKNRIQAWSLAKKYTLKQPVGQTANIVTFQDAPTNITGSTASADKMSYTVQFKKEDGQSKEDNCQGWYNNKSLFGPEELKIKLDYGDIYNYKQFTGFQVDGKRREQDKYLIYKNIYGIEGGEEQKITDNSGNPQTIGSDISIENDITNNLNKAVNNEERNNECSFEQLAESEIKYLNGYEYKGYTINDTPYQYFSKKLTGTNLFKNLANSFSAMFTFFSPSTLLGNIGTYPNPLCTRNFPEHYNDPFQWKKSPHFDDFYATEINDLKEPDQVYRNLSRQKPFNSLFISQNLNFDFNKFKENNLEELITGNISYNVQSSRINKLHNEYNSYISNTDPYFSDHAFFDIGYNNVYSYNSFLSSRPYKGTGGWNLYFYNPVQQTSRGATYIEANNKVRFENLQYTQYNNPLAPSNGRYFGLLFGPEAGYESEERETYNAHIQNYKSQMATTAAYDENGNADAINFAYIFDEIVLTPVFKDIDYAETATIDIPLETQALNFYETYLDNSEKPQKSIEMNSNAYTVEQPKDGQGNIIKGQSATFQFIIKVDKDYDFDPSSVKVYPENYAQISYEIFDEANNEYIYTINEIYKPGNLKVGIPTPQRHKYKITCNEIYSNFYDTGDGEKFLIKEVESGKDFEFETEPQNGYGSDSEILIVSSDIAYDDLVIDKQEAGSYETPGIGKIERFTNTQSLRNKYKITDLRSNITLTSKRKKRKINIIFTHYDGIEYKNTSGDNLNPQTSGDTTVPDENPSEVKDFTIEQDYGTNIMFVIEETAGYHSDNLTPTANGVPIDYANGVYKIKNITENTVVRVENIEKIKCKLVFTQHEGIAFKDEKDNNLESEKELRYGDSFTFKTEISDSYSSAGENYKLKLEYSSGTTEEMRPHDDNPNIYTTPIIKENCRIYAEGLEHKQHTIKLYNSSGITFKDKYGMNNLKDILETPSQEFITQRALHGQTFSFKVVADEGYDISDMKLFAKKDVTGTRQQLFPSNDVYTIENITEDYTVTLEKIEKTKYSAEIRLTDGVKCINQYGETMDTNLTISHGDSLSFYLSLDGAYSKATPKVTVKGNVNPIAPDTSGKYTISNITENKIIEVSGIQKNTYKATFINAEGVIYKNNKNKPFEGSLEVEYGDNLYFKITLMDAYDKSNPLVLLNDSKTIAESAGVYTVSNINSDITISVKNITKNPEEITMEDVNNVPDPVITNDDIDSVVKATLTYENLSDEEKEQVTNIAALQKAQKAAGELNHKSGDIYVNGLDWNIKVIAKELTNDNEKVDYLNSKIDRRELINLYDIYLMNLLTGEIYELPYGQSVDVTMPTPQDLTGYQNIVVAHEKSSGNIEYLETNITDNTVKFTATSFSLFGLAAKKIPNYLETPSSSQISVSGLIESEEELKTLLGEGAVSQIGDLTQPDNSLTSSISQSDSSENYSNTPLSWWNKFYKWALNNEFLIVLFILLLGTGIIWIIMLLAKKHYENEEN